MFSPSSTPYLSKVINGIAKNLALTYPEHLGAADRAYTLGCWSAIFHGYCLGILHFPLGSTLHTVGLHSYLLCDWDV